MAKLGSYYGLCPIIDNKSLLGINEDAEKENAIVTLGKKIAILYKLSDQKQLISWRTKDKFTSPIIFYKEEDKYCGTFNQNFLRTWTAEDEHLDKLKKYKFNKDIFTLLRSGEHSFIVFCNGAVALLKDAFENRKELNPTNVIDPESEYILDVLNISVGGFNYIGLVVQNEEKVHFILYTFDGQEQDKPKRFNLNKDGVSLSGYTLTESINDQVNLFTVWSDGKMYSQPLKPDKTDTSETFLTVLESISCKERVTMLPLNQDYVVMYGADSNQEGANLIIYNIQFRVTQSRQPFKMFTSGNKIWCLHNNLFLCVGQNLAVVPYHLDTEQLAALIGSVVSHELMIVEDLVVTNWDEKAVPVIERNGGVLKKDLEGFIQQGFPEGMICGEVLPKYIEDSNLTAITAAIDYFIDIPELHIVKLINFTLKADAKLFNSNGDSSKLPPNVAPMARCELIDRLLLLDFSDVMLLPHLRSSLDLTNSLTLLHYICYLLSDDGHLLCGQDISVTNKKLIEWGTVLLDANYQKMLLSCDEKVVDILKYFNSLVHLHLCCLDELKEAESVLIDVYRGKSLNRNKTDISKMYSIEKLKLC